MTEAEWLACEDPQKMGAWLLRGEVGWIGRIAIRLARRLAGRTFWESLERKPLLLACAYCQQEVPHESVEFYQALSAVTRAEEAADRPLSSRTADELEAATRLVRAASASLRDPHSVLTNYPNPELWKAIARERERLFCALIRDIFGNPFRPAAVDPAWLAWNDGAMRRIAQAIYEERAFDRMPRLADALEDAGCTVPDILDHCRSQAPHTRGCWVVDLVLGKE